MEELDGLQQELEAALSAVVVRLKSTSIRHFALSPHYRCESESCVKIVMCCRILKNIEVGNKRYYLIYYSQ